MKKSIIAFFISTMTMLACVNFTQDFIYLTIIFWVMLAISFAVLENVSFEKSTTKKTASKG